VLTEKIWGTSQRLLVTDFMQVERIQVRKGGYSSVHLHKRKNNLFVVEAGRLQVRLFDPWKKETARLFMVSRGDMKTVEPGIRHQFYADTSVVAYEVYWIDNPVAGEMLDCDDIQRFSESGVDENGELAFIASLQSDSRGAVSSHCCRCNNLLVGHEWLHVEWQGAIRQMCRDCQGQVGASLIAGRL
jgi:mannose-6-phosphate isomerase-like protein (cupin superfamily)